PRNIASLSMPDRIPAPLPGKPLRIATGNNLSVVRIASTFFTISQSRSSIADLDIKERITMQSHGYYSTHFLWCVGHWIFIHSNDGSNEGQAHALCGLFRLDG